MKISTHSIIALPLSILLMPLTSAIPSSLKRAAPIDISPGPLTGRKWPFHAKSSTCPANGILPSTYLTPSLIVPVSAKLPTVAFPPTNFPLITPNDFCSIFNLDIPATAVGQTCTLEFLFPDHDQTNAPYVYVAPPGGGHFTFTGYAYGSGAIDGTTYAMQPPPGPSKFLYFLHFHFASLPLLWIRWIKSAVARSTNSPEHPGAWQCLYHQCRKLRYSTRADAECNCQWLIV